MTIRAAHLINVTILLLTSSLAVVSAHRSISDCVGRQRFTTRNRLPSTSDPDGSIDVLLVKRDPKGGRHSNTRDINKLSTPLKPKRERRGDGSAAIHIPDEEVFRAATRTGASLAAHAALANVVQAPGFDTVPQLAATVALHAVTSGVLAPHMYRASKCMLGKVQECMQPCCRAVTEAMRDLDLQQRIDSDPEEGDDNQARFSSAKSQMRSRAAHRAAHKALKQKKKERQGCSEDEV